MKKYGSSLQMSNKQLECQMAKVKKKKIIYNSTKHKIHSHKYNKSCIEYIHGKLQTWWNKPNKI